MPAQWEVLVLYDSRYWEQNQLCFFTFYYFFSLPYLGTSISIINKEVQKQWFLPPFDKEALYWTFWNTFLLLLLRTVETWSAGPEWGHMKACSEVEKGAQSMCTRIAFAGGNLLLEFSVTVCKLTIWCAKIDSKGLRVLCVMRMLSYHERTNRWFSVTM